MRKLNTTSKIFIVLSFVLAGLIALILAFSIGAGVFKHIDRGGERVPNSMKTIVMELAYLPTIVRISAEELIGEISGKPYSLLISREKTVRGNWVHKFPAPEDDGYLLLSGLSATEGQSIVQLIRVADGQVMAKWVPDWRNIHDKLSHHRFGPKGNPKSFRAYHPLLLTDGSIVFNTGSALIRLPICHSKPTWLLNYPYHHSIELSPDGNSFWVPSVTESFATDNAFLKENLRDDSLAEISLDGHIIQNFSFSKILAENNMMAHVLGTSGLTLSIDPIHINQITPAPSDSPYWNRGDLLISARHTSTLYLYRPSTGKIVWYKQGPWLNQHSAHFIKDQAVAVFGNDVYGAKLVDQFVYKEAHNQIYLYEFKTNQTEKLHSATLVDLKPSTVSEGRAMVLDDLSVFIEETNNARLLKLDSKGNLIWSYINTYDDDSLGSVSWSRYMTAAELQKTISLENLRCSRN